MDWGKGSIKLCFHVLKNIFSSVSEYVDSTLSMETSYKNTFPLRFTTDHLIFFNCFYPIILYTPDYQKEYFSKSMSHLLKHHLESLLFLLVLHFSKPPWNSDLKQQQSFNNLWTGHGRLGSPLLHEMAVGAAEGSPHIGTGTFWKLAHPRVLGLWLHVDSSLSCGSWLEHL